MTFSFADKTGNRISPLKHQVEQQTNVPNMGQLLGLKSSTDGGTLDYWPKIFLECLVNVKVDGQRILQFKKRSCDQSQQFFADLLFNTKSSILEEEAGESPPLMPPASRKGGRSKLLCLQTGRESFTRQDQRFEEE